MIRRPPRSTLSSSSAASDVYKRQLLNEFDLGVASRHLEKVGQSFLELEIIFNGLLVTHLHDVGELSIDDFVHHPKSGFYSESRDFYRLCAVKAPSNVTGSVNLQIRRAAD